jgi:hypothetical protein
LGEDDRRMLDVVGQVLWAGSWRVALSGQDVTFTPAHAEVMESGFA